MIFFVECVVFFLICVFFFLDSRAGQFFSYSFHVLFLVVSCVSFHFSLCVRHGRSRHQPKFFEFVKFFLRP